MIEGFIETTIVILALTGVGLIFYLPGKILRILFYLLGLFFIIFLPETHIRIIIGIIFSLLILQWIKIEWSKKTRQTLS